MRTRTSPTPTGTMIQCSSTGSLSIGAACTSSRTLRACAGVSSYGYGGFAVASANARAAGSSTTGWVMVVISCASSGRGAAVLITSATTFGRGERAVYEHDGWSHDRLSTDNPPVP